MRVSSSIPFSRSIVLTASMISLLISLPFVNEVAPHDRVVGDGHARAVGDGKRKLLGLGCFDRAAELLAAGDVVVDTDRDLAADRIPKVRRRAQRALDPGRGDV